MVFIACSKAENVDTMRWKSSLAWYQELEPKVLQINPETGNPSTVFWKTILFS
jgi:hypothetical protein